MGEKCSDFNNYWNCIISENELCVWREEYPRSCIDYDIESAEEDTRRVFHIIMGLGVLSFVIDLFALFRIRKNIKNMTLTGFLLILVVTVVKCLIFFLAPVKLSDKINDLKEELVSEKEKYLQQGVEDLESQKSRIKDLRDDYRTKEKYNIPVLFFIFCVLAFIFLTLASYGSILYSYDEEKKGKQNKQNKQNNP